MTYPPTPEPDEVRPPPPDPPIEAYQPPAPHPYAYGTPPATNYGVQAYGAPSAPGYGVPPFGTPSAPGYPVQAYGTPPAPSYGIQPYGTPAAPSYGLQPSGAPPAPGYDYGTPYPYQSYPYRQGQPPTEGMAIASLAVSCVSVFGLCFWTVGGLLGILGAIFGHVARRRIRATGAGGAGMALAGIIVGWAATAIAVVVGAVFISVLVSDPSTY